MEEIIFDEIINKYHKNHIKLEDYQLFIDDKYKIKEIGNQK